jgi:hypothetical protein
MSTIDDEYERLWSKVRKTSTCWIWTGLSTTNTSGVHGVSWHKAKGKWQARVTHNGHVSAEYHDSFEAAARAVRALRLRLHTNNLLDRVEGAA